MKNVSLLILASWAGLSQASTTTASRLLCPAVYAPVCSDANGAQGPARFFNNFCEAAHADYTPRNQGAMIQFDIVGEDFWVYTTSAAAIAEAHGLLASGKLKVPLMMLADGASCSGLWTFHAVPDSLTFADVTIELCDGRPSYVEENKKEWLQKVKNYCPWNARVIGVYEPL
ncbi:MAG TPA: hypothetical protein VE954_12270 [Oligoflexus sp.]|uniref:BP74-related protein n=1 Tax=Oligoflexus sp. TaxID=1971216 RepID=UPI002D62B400|nr:hypothetical protein [Oligoflexus sp.]HYX33882.1 hypothetical protein [Oligoflexus sp.]